MAATSTKDFWDKLQTLSVLAASILVPLAVGFVGNQYSTAMKDSENRVKYVELAVSILKTEPKADNEALREWAADVLIRHSTVPVSAELQKQLKSQRIDFGSGFYSPMGGYVDYPPAASKK